MPGPATGWLDRAAARRAIARAARRGPFRDPLADEIARRMLERLDYVKLAPRRIVAAGGVADPLCTRYPAAQALAIAATPADSGAAPRSRWETRLRSLFGSQRRSALVADIGRLPLAAGACDLLWSNLALAQSDAPGAVLEEWSRVLAVDGLLMFSTLGPDTLKELRAAFAADAAPHVHPFVDMHDLGDMLVAAGFADPVMDMEVLTLTYPTFEGLIADLRASGRVNALARRRRGLTGRHIWDRARRDYAAAIGGGRIPASFEVVYGHAWKPRARTLPDGTRIIKFDRARPR